MDTDELTASELMLKGVSMAARVKNALTASKSEALKIMLDGVAYMNRAIELCPDHIENRKLRFSHLLGISKESPSKFLNELKDDYTYLKAVCDGLEDGDKAFFYATAGDYHLFLGERERGIEYLELAQNLSADSLSSKLAKLSLEKIL